MKNAKKLFALLLALVMVFALGLTAFAADATGTITIENPQVGTTYTLYQFLDADGKAVTDIADAVAAREDLFTVNETSKVVTIVGSAADVQAFLTTNVAHLTKKAQKTPTANGTLTMANTLDVGTYFVTCTEGSGKPNENDVVVSLASASDVQMINTGWGSITIVSAEPDKAYVAYKVFDVSYDGQGSDRTSRYYIPADGNTALLKLIKDACAADPTYDAAGDCPFKVMDDGETIMHRGYNESTQSIDNESYGRGWLKKHMTDGYKYYETPAPQEGTPKEKVMSDAEYAALSAEEQAKWTKGTQAADKVWTGWAATAKTYTQTITSGNTVVFNPIDYGYYLITCGNEATVTVDTANPTQEVEDKNTKNPGQPDKAVSGTDKLFVPGDDVDFTVSFMTVNFQQQNWNDTPAQILSYSIVDRAKGLDFKAVKSIQVYKNADFSDASPITIAAYDATTNPNGYKVEDTTATLAEGLSEKKIVIPWAVTTGSGASAVTTSLYPSPAYLKVTYTDTVNAYIAEEVDGDTHIPVNVGKNRVTTSYTTSKGDSRIGEDSEYVYTTGISIGKRLGNTNTQLTGAKFKLYKLVGRVDPITKQPVLDEETETQIMDRYWYKYTPAVQAKDAEGEKPAVPFTPAKIEWITDDKMAEATEVLADNNYGTQEFGGLTEGVEYYLVETVAPEGYVAPGIEKPFKVELTVDETKFSSTGTRNVFVTAAVDDKELADNDLNYATVLIANGKSPEMPSTGGAGTVAIIAIGSVLFLATAIVLVTKKRMYNEG